MEPVGGHSLKNQLGESCRCSHGLRSHAKVVGVHCYRGHLNAAMAERLATASEAVCRSYSTFLYPNDQWSSTGLPLLQDAA